MAFPLPPKAKQVFHSYQHLGRTFQDPYTWLQDKQDPEVIAYLEAENAYAQATLAHTQELQEKLYLEMRGRIKEDDATAPENRGAYSYYTRNQTGKQYRLFCRKANIPGMGEEILLDENKLAEELAYCRVGDFEPSPDHNLAIYLLDTTGAWVFDLYVIDLRSGEIVYGPVHQTGYSCAWASDSRTLFYTTFDTAHRPYKAFRHVLGQEQAEDAMVYHEADDAFSLSVERSRSGQYLFFTAASHTTSDVRILKADQSQAAPVLVEPRRPWHEYYLEHQGDFFWVRTNYQAENFRLMRSPAANPAEKNWLEVLPHRPDVLVEAVFAFDDYLVLFERQAGLRQVRVSAPDGVSDIYSIEFPDPAYAVGIDTNPIAQTSTVRFFYSSLIAPQSTIDYDLAGRCWQVSKQQEIPSGYAPSQYVTERMFATASDGARVPISLVYRRGSAMPGPLLLYGYGSYGASMEASFDARRLSLLDRGVAFAIAHVRGGKEMGRSWYEQGRLLQKRNTFTDFIACAEHLVAGDYTSPEHLAMMGASAGGLLVTAVANLRPDLFKAVIALVPFTNVVVAMLTPELPLTIPEYEQWGNPNEPEAFDYMLSYSPYENVTARDYPNILARGGINDLQVPYWDPAKWVARLRASKTDGNRLLLLTNMGAGHGGASGRFDALRETALNYAFLLDVFGISE